MGVVGGTWAVWDLTWGTSGGKGAGRCVVVLVFVSRPLFIGLGLDRLWIFDQDSANIVITR